MDKLTHWEIPTTDMAKTKAFYASLFGWQTQGWADDYVLFAVEGGTGGALMKVDKMPEHASAYTSA